uniref:PDZ domain-containing protein n=1 Tax=Caenorhabditis tropicalis TaxID=1561998 RepID=A0A1I7UJB8_9PELO
MSPSLFLCPNVLLLFDCQYAMCIKGLIHSPVRWKPKIRETLERLTSLRSLTLLESPSSSNAYISAANKNFKKLSTNKMRKIS